MFKTITAKFKVVNDTLFKKGRFGIDRSDWIIKVERYKSGATAYGDKSGHSVIIENKPEYMGHYYDTRYDGIPTDKRNWLAYWKAFVEYLYQLEIELIDYQEGSEE